MTSGISGIFLHVFNSSDGKQVDEITKQRAELRELLEIATNHLKDCQYNQAKTNYLETKSCLNNCKKQDEMNLPEELDFYITVMICYSFIMELDSVKDVTNEDFLKENENMMSEIDGLIKQYPKRHFPLFLRLLYSFKKECWREAIYYCELVQNFKIFPEEEKKYKSTPIFSKDLIPELDIDYCNEAVHNIEEASIYGLVEKLAKLDELKNTKVKLLGLNWVNLWSKKCNDNIIKRLRSYKKPMNSFQLHKLFHTEILPIFYTLNKNVGVEKSLFCYYKKEFMYQCEECLRAKLQLESRNELFGRLTGNSLDVNVSDDSDVYDTDDDENDDDLGSQNEDLFILPPSSEEKDKNKEKSSTCKCDASKETEEEKDKTTILKKTSKSQQTQTDKIKIGHRYVQTECSIRKKSIALQTDGPKLKKQEKQKLEEIKCKDKDNNSKVFDLLEEIKNQLSLSKTEMKDALQDQLSNLLKELKQIREESFDNEKSLNRSFEIIQSKEIIAKLEKQILLNQETFDKERKELCEKNVFLQKLLIDQINDKYLLYKNIYSGLENNCRVIITNVTELQNLLTIDSVPNPKDNRLYLSRWEKTLFDLQRKNAHLKVFYKKIKSKMLHLSEYECSDWPDIAEIPIGAFGFLFDNLKLNLKNIGHQKPVIQNMMNSSTPPLMQNQPNQVAGGQIYHKMPITPNVRAAYIGPVLRYGPYQQSPPPIPIPQNPNSQYPPWMQNSNPNAQMYPPNNQWPNNPNMTYFKSFVSNAVSNKKQTLVSNSFNFNRGGKLEKMNSNQAAQNSSIEDVPTSIPWNVVNTNSNFTKNSETSNPQNHDVTVSQDGNPDFSPFSNFGAMSTSIIPNFINQGNQGIKAQKDKSSDQATQNEKNLENLIDRGFWDFDTYEEKVESNVTGKVREVSDNQESENARKVGETSITSCIENLSEKVIQRPVRTIPKLVNVCKDEDSQYDAEKELFQYLKAKCSDVNNDELMSTILKVLKKFNGSFNNVPKTDILKEVRSSILSVKHGVWIPPKSPLVDWGKNALADSYCSICFDDLTQRPKCVLPCKHEYHKDCISQWLRTNSVCPICRVHSVVDEDYPPLL